MIMKRLAYIVLIVLFAVILGSCAKTTSQIVEPPSLPIEGMINPGDKIGEFLITTGNTGGITYLWELDSECVKQEDAEIYTCRLNPGAKVNVSWGVYRASSGQDLDVLWSEHIYKMLIDGRPVNLDGFGSIDVVHPRVGKIRHWNVVITANRPGEITIHSDGVVGGDPFGDTKKFIFGTP